MSLTLKQLKAIDKNGNTTVEACPGAGKTRTLIAKLVQVVEEVKGSSRRIACITYTNAAVYEIESRMLESSSPDSSDICDISTIHGFCLNNILRPYSWKLAELSKGFKIVTTDSDEYRSFARQTCLEHGLSQNLVNSFEHLNILIDGSAKVPEGITTEAAYDFWNKLYANGMIDFPSLLWFSYKILLNNKSLIRALGSKYQWFLIDEFQDTSEIQLEMFKFIHDVGRTKFFIVGDKNQSIYSFAGANPENIETFSEYIDSYVSPSLNENFRSSLPIVGLANSLICNLDPMVSVKGKTELGFIPEYIHTNNVNACILNHFLNTAAKLSIPYGEIAILAPWWPNLLSLGRSLRESNYPITGPGARPYRRAHLIAPFLEQLCSVLAENNKKQMFRLEKEFSELVSLMGGNFSLVGFERRVYLNRILRFAKNAGQRLNYTQPWILAVTEYLIEIFRKDFNISEDSCMLVSESVKGIFDDMNGNRIDPSLLMLREFTLFSSNKDSIKLLTIHRSKGREFDAVAIINVNDDRIPNFRATSQKDIDEARRLLYVGITRARKYLLVISDSENPRNKPSRFLTEMLRGPHFKKII